MIDPENHRIDAQHNPSSHDHPPKESQTVIRTHPNDPPLTVREAGEIGRITAMAVIRGGVLTTRQQNKIDRILVGAWEREEKKRIDAGPGQARR